MELLLSENYKLYVESVLFDLFCHFIQVCRRLRVNSHCQPDIHLKQWKYCDVSLRQSSITCHLLCFCNSLLSFHVVQNWVNSYASARTHISLSALHTHRIRAGIPEHHASDNRMGNVIFQMERNNLYAIHLDSNSISRWFSAFAPYHRVGRPSIDNNDLQNAIYHSNAGFLLRLIPQKHSHK